MSGGVQMNRVCGNWCRAGSRGARNTGESSPAQRVGQESVGLKPVTLEDVLEGDSEFIEVLYHVPQLTGTRQVLLNRVLDFGHGDGERLDPLDLLFA